MDGVPIGEAAQRLGTSPEAIRKRISRRTMRGYKVDGQWYVILDESGRPDSAPSGRASGPTVEHPDGWPDDRPAAAALAVYRELVEQHRAEIARLVEQLAIKDRQLEQANVIIARLASRVPELPAAASAMADKDSTHECDVSQPQPTAPAPTRPPWWRRLWPVSAG